MNSDYYYIYDNHHPFQAMHDLDIAEAQLAVDNLSIIFVRNGQIIYSSCKTGLTPLVDAIQTVGEALEGSSMADKVVGRAAALLAVYAKVKSIYAFTIASGALHLLNQHSIPLRYEKMVKHILNRDGDDICPFEKSVQDTNNPGDALHRISHTISVLSTMRNSNAANSC
jgi:hypothetical protein